MKRLPFNAALLEYEGQAGELLAGWKADHRDAIRLAVQTHPQFLDTEIRWLPKKLTASDIRNAPFDREAARLSIARWYDFGNWSRLEEYVSAVDQPDSPVARFESAVEAIIDGEAATLTDLLERHPELAHTRSTRVTHLDPPIHHASLLHYVAANGVEGYRQRTPPNAVEIATILLRRSADADALADMYGGQHTTMSMLVSSGHPAEAGVQSALVDTLVDFGATVESLGTGEWISPLATALAFGYLPAAETLVRRGARVDTLSKAAGLGMFDEVRAALPDADALERHRGTALAAQLGHIDVLTLLLDAGEDPNRYNPKGNHGHSTPLHQAVWAGHANVVRLLVERGARLDIRDTIYRGTPLGWALHHGSRAAIADYLKGHGASTD